MRYVAGLRSGAVTPRILLALVSLSRVFFPESILLLNIPSMVLII